MCSAFDSLKKNGCGYNDPTAYQAILNIEKERRKKKKENIFLINNKKNNEKTK